MKLTKELKKLKEIFNSIEKEYGDDLGKFNLEIPSPPQNLTKFLETALITNNRQSTILKVSGGSYHTQCFYGCRRSLHDIFIITRNYFPEVSLFDVCVSLATLLNKKDNKIFANYCTKIQNFVFFNRNYYEDGNKNDVYLDCENGILRINEYGEIHPHYKNTELDPIFRQLTKQI